MDLHLNGKVAVITGGAAGIGKAAALEFIKEGVQVAIFGRRLEKLEEFAAECKEQGAEIYYESVDVTDTKAVEAFAGHVWDKYGRLDIWVNNAGIAINKEFTEFTQEDYDAIMKIDLEGVFHGTQIAAKYMKEQKSGVILNASSFASLIPHANGVIYAAAKAGVSNMTRSTAAALAPWGIRVISYIPGMIMTAISQEFIAEYRDKFTKDISLGRLGVPEDLAKPLVFLCSDAASYISGCDIEITGGKFAVQDCAMSWRMADEHKS